MASSCSTRAPGVVLIGAWGSPRRRLQQVRPGRRTIFFSRGFTSLRPRPEGAGRHQTSAEYVDAMRARSGRGE